VGAFLSGAHGGPLVVWGLRKVSILRKPLSAISVADLDALIKSTARETGELEFKGALPFVPTKGQSAVSDRWIEKGDRIGDYARDQVLAEIVAFANADGGTLVLGLHETKEEPRRAERLEALPNCEDLSKRLLDSTEDIIEPRLQSISAQALPAAADGSGYVLLRVGKSSIGPHRLTTTREFYVRRGERSARMSVREIKDLTLDIARTGDRMEAIFAERTALANRRFATLISNARGKEVEGTMPLVIRVTALPSSPQHITNITGRRDLWWSGKSFSTNVDGEDYRCEYPIRNWTEPAQIRLRSLVSEEDLSHRSTPRLIRSDGLVEFSLIHPKGQPTGSGSDSILYMSWLICLVAGVVSQVNQLRERLAWDSVAFGLEIELWSTPPLGVSWSNQHYSGYTMRSDLPLRLPRYSLASDDDRNEIVTSVVRDILNACGDNSTNICELPWDSLKNAAAPI
jgi:hypothetical protein